jgi:hypothetical protein
MASREWLAGAILATWGWSACATAPPAENRAPGPSPAGAADVKAEAPPAAPEAPPLPPADPVSFDLQVRPILEARCRPCHFEGGRMYARLPFDCPQTIRSLGTKLFTRIMREEERSSINLFLAQSPDLDGEPSEHCRLIGSP